MWHCTRLSSRDVRKSSRPEGIAEVVDAPVAQTFSEVLAAFVCIERLDSESTVPSAVHEISLVGDLVICRDVVIVPFAHLSSDLMKDSPRARNLLALIAEGLESEGMTAALTSFGYHKEFELDYHAKGHPGAVAFRDVPSLRSDDA